MFESVAAARGLTIRVYKSDQIKGACADKMQKQTTSIHFTVAFNSTTRRLLVQRLGVGGSGGNVSVTGSLVGAGGLLQGLGISEVGGAGEVVRGSVAGDEVEGKSGEHVDVAYNLHRSRSGI